MNNQYESSNLFFGDLTGAASAFTNLPLVALQSADKSISMTLGCSIDSGIDAYVSNLKHSSSVFKIPEKLSKSIFEPNGTTETGRWMDEIKGASHRMHRHHFFDDAITVYKDKDLRLLDFYRHLATDIPTKTGIPLLSTDVINSIADAFGVSASKVVPWVSMNLVDAGASVFSSYHAAGNVISVTAGNAHWGVPYAIDTFGAGGAEIVGGIFASNPILVASGATDIGCGIVTAHEYYTQPQIFGTNVFDLLHSVEISAGISAILALAEVAIAGDNYTAAEKIKKVATRISVSSSLSFLSVVSQPLGIMTSVGYSGYNLAKTLAARTDNYVGSMPIHGNFSHELDRRICENSLGENFTNDFLKSIKR